MADDPLKPLNVGHWAPVVNSTALFGPPIFISLIIGMLAHLRAPSWIPCLFLWLPAIGIAFGPEPLKRVHYNHSGLVLERFLKPSLTVSWQDVLCIDVHLGPNTPILVFHVQNGRWEDRFALSAAYGWMSGRPPEVILRDLAAAAPTSLTVETRGGSRRTIAFASLWFLASCLLAYLFALLIRPMGIGVAIGAAVGLCIIMGVTATGLRPPVRVEERRRPAARLQRAYRAWVFALTDMREPINPRANLQP